MTDRMSDPEWSGTCCWGAARLPPSSGSGDALVERVSKLWSGSCDGGLEAVVGEVKAFREEHARSMRHVERRLVRLEAGRSESETPSPTGAETEPTKRRYVRPRTYPQLVTPEAEPDEDLVYGEAAPVIVEWRRVRAEFLKTRTTLDRTEVQEPMLEMEIALVGEHELTLPPASFPWDEFDRRDKVWELTQDLKRVRAERNRALLRRWLRRVLTLSDCGGSRPRSRLRGRFSAVATSERSGR